MITVHLVIVVRELRFIHCGQFLALLYDITNNKYYFITRLILLTSFLLFVVYFQTIGCRELVI